MYVKAKQVLDSGGIGRVRGVHGEFLKYELSGDEPPLPAPRTNEEKMKQWKLWRSMFGEVAVETYCHYLDAINRRSWAHIRSGRSGPAGERWKTRRPGWII